MIEFLTALMLVGAAPAAPSMCVRDTTASLPDSGAVAGENDSLPHAVSRTLSPPTPVVIVPTVHVDAALERARRRAPTAFVTTLDARRGARTLASLDEVLIEAAGVRVTQYGGLGAFSTMSLRGAPPGHVTVLLDGIPLASAAQGVTDLASLPATAVSTIEVYRGAAPVSMATPTPGGAVNLVTQAGTTARSLRLTTGSFGTGEAQGTLGARHGAWSLLAHGGWQGSNGDYLYQDDNGTPLEPADDQLATRANARFDAASLLVRGGYAPSDRVQASTRVEYFRRGQGVPGPGSTPALTARYGQDRTVVASVARFSRGVSTPALELRASIAREHSRLRDTQGELGYGRVDTRERFDDATAATELVSPVRWSMLSLRAGGAVRGEQARPAAPSAGLPDPPASHRQTRSAWASADLRGLRDHVLLHASRRWDQQQEDILDTRSTGAIREQSAERTLDSPQLGARIRVTQGLELRANWSRSGRAPGFDELFGNDGSITGNPSLVPEHAESWDAGLAWGSRWGRLRWDASWSHHESHAHDMVLFERSMTRGARAINIGRAHIEGEESELRVAYAGAELSASTARLSATDESPIAFYHGRTLPQRAPRESFLRLTWRGGPWTLAGDVEYLGETFLDRANFKREPSRTLVGAAIGRSFHQLSLTVEGRNLGDRLVQDIAGFPLPGRMLLCSLTLDLAEVHAAH